MLMRNWLPALCAAMLVLSTGCGKECVDAIDCRNEKGRPPEGQFYVCAESRCELRNEETPQPAEDAGTDAGETPTDAGTDAGTLTCTPACAATQECDISSGTSATCVACLTDAHCAGVDATKPVCLNKTACVQCTTNAHCGVGQVCNASNTCEAQPAPTASDTSAQIAAFLAAADGAQATPLAVQGAYVTYTKPAVGDDVAGFFLQAEANGPAMFVSDAAALPQVKVGDRISLSVTEKVTTTGVRTAKAVSGVTKLSEGHPVKNLSTATPTAGLAFDQSKTKDLQSNVAAYESELVYIAGTLADVFNSGTGHVAFNINNADITGTAVPRLRVPTALSQQLDLVKGCTFTLKAGPMWRFNTNAQASAYEASDLAVDCPAPTLVNALPVSLTQVRLVFDRSIAQASVTNAEQQFTFNNSLKASAASVSGREVLVTTTAQTPGTEYTATVANSVKDTLGKPVTPGTTPVTFVGFQNLSARGGRLVITGTGFTGASAVTLGGTAQVFAVDSDTQVTIASVADETPVGSQPIQVTTSAGPQAVGDTVVLSLLINEVDSDQPVNTAGVNDADEFVEIATGVPNLRVSGFALVLFNGNDDRSYLSLDLNGTTNASGLLVAGSSAAVNTTPGLGFSVDTLQNGPDAVVLTQGSASAFPNGTAVPTSGIIDAVVYETNDPDDAGLLNPLMAAAPGRVQADENKNLKAVTESVQRCSGERRDGRAFSKVGAPSPGAANTCP